MSPRRRKYLKILGIVLGVLLVLEVVFWFYANALLSGALRRVVLRATDSVYYASFDRLHVNLFTRSLYLTNFKLIPDTSLRQKRNLYQIEFDEFALERLGIFSLLFKEQLYFKSVSFLRPRVYFYSLKQKKLDTTLPTGYTVVKRDFLSLFFKYFNSVYVYQLRIVNGEFGFLKQLRNTFNARSVTLIINRFYVDRQKFYDKDLFTSDFVIQIEDYTLTLGNSHRLEADLLEVNSRQKQIVLRNTHLFPERLLDSANAFDVFAKEIKLTGADFQDIYLNRQIDLQGAYVDGLNIKFYKYLRKSPAKKFQLKTPYQVYLLVKDRLKFLHIRQVEVVHGSFAQYTADRFYPWTRVGGINLRLDDLFLDSANAFDTNRFFFARGVYLRLDDFSTKLKDSLHLAVARRVIIDSKSKFLAAYDFRLWPYGRIPGRMERKVLNNVFVPAFEIQGFDIARFYHTGELRLKSLILSNPQIKVSSYQPVRNKRKIGLQQLLGGIVRFARIGRVKVTGASYDFKRFLVTQHIEASGKMDLDISDFCINPQAPTAKQAIDFASVRVGFNDLSYYNSESIHLIRIDSLLLNTSANVFTISGLSFVPTTLSDSLLLAHKKTMKFDFYLPQLSISSFDLKRYLSEDRLLFGAVRISRPKMHIFSYPELSQRRRKDSLRQVIRRRVADSIVLRASQVIFDIYQSVSRIDSSVHRLLQEKLYALDSIQNYALDLVLEIHIPGAQIRLEDTTAKITERIKRLVYQSFDRLVLAQSEQEIDSVWQWALARLAYLKQLSERPFMNFEEIAQSFASVVSEIRADSILLDQASLKFSQVYADRSMVLFDNILKVSMYGFDFRPDSLSHCEQNFLCSRSIRVEIDDYHYYFSDSIHQAAVEALILDTHDSSIVLRNVVLSADSSRGNWKMLSSATLPYIRFSGVDYRAIVDSNVLRIGKLELPRGFVHLLAKAESQKRGISKPSAILLPAFLRRIDIDAVRLQNVLFRLESRVKDLRVSAKLNLSLEKVRIDSVLSLNLRDLPFDFWKLSGKKVRLWVKEQTLRADSFSINSRGQVNLGGLAVQTPKAEAQVGTLRLRGLNYAGLIDERSLHLTGFYVDSAQVSVKQTQGKKRSKPFRLKDFELYPLLKGQLKDLRLDTFRLTRGRVWLPGDTLSDIRLEVLGFLLDSTVRLDSPRLFYADNIILEMRDYQRPLSKFYNLSFKRLGINLAQRQIYADSLRIAPPYSVRKFMALHTWRTTYTDVLLNHLSVNNIDWDSLLFGPALYAQSIFVNGFKIYAFMDKSLPHDYSKRKPHFIELLMKMPIPLDIRTVILRNGQIVYHEQAPTGSRPGEIELSQVNLILSNVTNRPAPVNPYLNLRMSALLQNQGYLTLYGFFKLDTVDYPFKFYGFLGRMDLTVFNSYLVYAAYLKVTSGKLRRAEFVINGQDSIATGYLKAIYHNLAVEVLKPSAEFAPKPRRFLSFLADVVVRSDNPKYGIFYRTGTIAYVHDRSFGDIKFWVKALLSGLKSLALFENKRELKRINQLRLRQRLRRGPG